MITGGDGEGVFEIACSPTVTLPNTVIEKAQIVVIALRHDEDVAFLDAATATRADCPHPITNLELHIVLAAHAHALPIARTAASDTTLFRFGGS